jgi:glucosylceramidase
MHFRSAAPLLVATLSAATCTELDPLRPAESPGAALVAAGDTVAVWMTTGNKSALLAKQPTLTFGTATNKSPTIAVDGTTTYQTMAGFGYTLTGGSALVINRMPAAARDALLRELFVRDNASLGVSHLRLSIGASDLSAAPFTYDEVPAGQTDPTLASFTIDAERADLLPVLKQILAINPSVPLLATPWTAPRWMKDNGAYVGGSLLPPTTRPTRSIS